MEVKLFGQSVRIEIILLCILLGIILGTHLLCSCCKFSLKKGLDILNARSIKEGLTLLEGTDIDYKMGSDMQNSWTNQNNMKYDYNDWYKSLENNTSSIDINKDIENGNMHFFAYNKFDSKCCPSSYTNDLGCACITPEQIKYLNTRGGNRTYNSVF